MKKAYYMTNYFSCLLTLIVLAGLLSCVGDEVPLGNHQNPDDNDSYLQIYMNLSELKSAAANSPSTKAMDDEAERMIDPAKLHVLAFKEDEGVETYAYKAPLSGPVTYDSENETKAVITVKLAKTLPAEKYRLVIIANHDILSTSLIPGVTLKADVLNQLSYTVSGKWNADSDSYTPLPMWGESGVVAILESMPNLQLNLYRALARVDVGLNFTTTNGIPTEQTDGLSNFKLKEVNVYRTYTKGYVAPLNSLMTGYDQPFIPADAVRNGDNAPLSYTVSESNGTDNFVRNIYIPEADLPASVTNNNIHTLVIGGYYNGSNTVTYYRLDFSTETNPGDERTFLPVLRNHRYVFNISQVRGPGLATAQAALESTATIENISYNLINWDEAILKMEVQGQYYFGLDQWNLHFDSQPDESIKFKYQTNIPLEKITYEWKNGSNSVFEVANWNNTAKEFTIRTKSENTTNMVLIDTLFVKAGTFSIPIHVEQKYVNFEYEINCETVTVSGVYKNGETLNPDKHQITFSITANNNSILGKNYEIETLDLEGDHGVKFSAAGTFTSLTETITLTGSGTLDHNSADGAFNLRIKSNSSSGSYCEATINPVDDVMNIVVMSDPANAYGYAISRANGGAGKVFHSLSNFGPYDYSIIKTAGEYNFIKGTPYDFYNSKNTEIYKWVTSIGNNGKIADIVYIAYGALFYLNEPNTPSTSDLLIQYLDKGGVIVIFMEDGATSQYFNRRLFDNKSIGWQVVSGGAVYPLSANPALFSDEEERQDVLKRLEGDPILNGPFGDIRDKQIGEDVGSTGVLTNFPLSHPDVTIYSYNNNLNSNPKVTNSTAVVGYKYESENRNLFFWCDGGLMSSGTNGLPHTGHTLTPFNWDINTMFPIPMPSYGSVDANRMPVYNSTMFCNMMAWAIKKSQSLKSKREGKL